MELAPSSLTWAEVDPARHPFDREAVAATVHALGPAARVPRRPADPMERANSRWGHGVARQWADAMSQALVDSYGRWATGWRWSVGGADYDGGPVGAWCCPGHSVTSPEETVDKVVAALCEWRDWLENLAAWFQAYPLDLADIEEQRPLWESVAKNLILQVVDHTGAESAWYGHCHMVLTWFLSHWGVAPEQAGDLVAQAISGRFQSWSGPDLPLLLDVAERLADSVRPELASGPDAEGGVVADADAELAGAAHPDHLATWLTIRETVPWPEFPPGDSTAQANDIVAEDIRSFDGALDPNRAAGLLAALELARADAARGAVLDFALLQSWQQHILGTPEPPFRTEPAFAKGGHERYGIAPDTRARLDACLAESAPAPTGQALSLSARAARAYLDVCFFHPFADGNARAAFLTLVFVLARENVSLTFTGLIRRVSFSAADPQDAVILTRYVSVSSAA
jgi:hypothetical protein